MTLGGLAIVEGPNYFTNRRFSPPPSCGGDRRLAAEISALYDGLEGDYWPEGLDDPEAEGGLFLPSDKSDLAIEFFTINQKPGMRLIAVESDQRPPIALPPSFFFCGYDVGMIESASDKFSCVFNEVLFGTHENLTAFKPCLNSSKLFSNTEHANEFLRQRLSVRSVERFMDNASPMIFRIWKYTSNRHATVGH